MPVFLLSKHSLDFPDPSRAEPDGLLAVGGDLRPERLLSAYRMGIFPWFQNDFNGLYYWYSPAPRCVLFPADLVVHKSMRSIFNQKKFRYTLDTAFREVMQACSERDEDELTGGTWINDSFLNGYTQMHELGYAHSVEVWEGDELVGGLYGLSIGRVFFGESMFARRTNASKAGFITLVKALQQHDFTLIDCQQESAHLLSLGATAIPRKQFTHHLISNNIQSSLVGKWSFCESGGLTVHENTQ